MLLRQVTPELVRWQHLSGQCRDIDSQIQDNGENRAD
jgi:hypothetical protein